jgi:hypothetical protein
MSKQDKINEALNILIAIGLPRAQQNDRSALSLLALVNIDPDKSWGQAEDPLMGITPIMDWIRKYYKKYYAPNTRETIRRQTMHQFVSAGIAIYNPDDPDRPVNSPKAVYQVERNALFLFRSYNTSQWTSNLADYLAERQTLSQRYAKERDLPRIPVNIKPDKIINLSPGEHSELIRSVIEVFGPCFIPGGILIYVGDTGDKWGYFDSSLLEKLGVKVGSHGKMPDAVIYNPDTNWLFLIESVTSHGPVNGKRHEELSQLFGNSSAGLVYVTAFPNRPIMSRYLSDLAWETEVWIADSPTHLIHFNGVRFLGPYSKP